MKMNDLRRTVGVQQALFFATVVIMLGVPYFLISIEFTGSQIKWVLACYAWEGLILVGLCSWLPMRWTRAFEVLWKEDQDSSDADRDGARQRALAFAFRFPTLVAITMFLVLLGAYCLGVFQVWFFAHLNRFQTIQCLVSGVILSLIYGLCCFFNNDRIVAKALAQRVREDEAASIQGAGTIFTKVLAVFVSIVVTAILFQGVVHL